MKKVRLIEPTVELENEYLDMLKDWKDNNEKLMPWVLNLDYTDFPQMVKKLKDYSNGKGVEESFVEHSTYWLVDEDNTILGVVNIRHRLNRTLMNRGGHVGYGIRPSYRKKGLATELLRLTLEIVKNMGLNKILLTCNKNNIGSAKTIKNNGGVLESEGYKNGKIIQRYWIYLNNN